MGGISSSNLSLNQDDNLLFNGNLSLANNGGFAFNKNEGRSRLKWN